MSPFAALLAFVAVVCAAPSSITPDPNGAKNVGNGQGLQFITGACLSTADCSQAVVQSCCAFIAGGAATGICSGIAVGAEAGKAGCGFGDGGAAAAVTNSPAAAVTVSPAAAVTEGPAAAVTYVARASTGTCAVDTSLAGSASVGTGAGSQFITGQCFNAADCASACCVAQSDGTAICKAALATTQAGLSCDFSCTPQRAKHHGAYLHVRHPSPPQPAVRLSLQ